MAAGEPPGFNSTHTYVTMSGKIHLTAKNYNPSPSRYSDRTAL
jgi:hypothetical protein